MSTLFKTFKKSTQDSDILLFSSTRYIPTLHHHAEYEFLYIESGSGNFTVETEEIPVNSGDILFLSPNQEHSFESSSENCVFHIMVFKSDVFGTETSMYRKNIDQIKINTKLDISNSLKEKFKTLASRTKLKAFGLEFQIKAYLFELISYILDTSQFIKYAKLISTMSSHSQAVQVACKYMQDHFSEKIEYDDILELSNYSKSQFIKIFKKETGMNITDYLNRCRIEHACSDLINTDKNITEIAIENGFNNIQYFSKRFKETMNCTPREYKSNILQTHNGER